MGSCSSRETFIEREPGETANDRNDRAIRVAAKWYSQHLKKFESQTDGLKVVLLTNDQGNKQKAEESGQLVYKCNLFQRSSNCFASTRTKAKALSHTFILLCSR